MARAHRNSVGNPRAGVDGPEAAASQHRADLVQLLERLLLLHCKKDTEPVNPRDKEKREE